MSKTLVSILSPVKNEAPFIAEMINTVLKQDYPNWELILVDDNSQDNTIQIIEGFEDARIKLFKNNGTGIIEALKTAFNHANGSLITRMDGDDLMPSHKLELFVQNIKPSTMLTGKVSYFSDKPISEGYKKYEGWLNEVCTHQSFEKEIYRECITASGNWMAHKSDLEAIGFPHLLQYPEDYDLVFKWYQAGLRFEGIPQTTHLWREHPARTSRNSDIYAQQSFFELKIPYWLSIEHTSENEIIVIGFNQKSKITAAILAKHNVPFRCMSIEKQHINQVIENVMVEDFDLTKLKPTTSQLLIHVYPSEKIRTEINQLLNKQGFELGKNYWYV